MNRVRASEIRSSRIALGLSIVRVRHLREANGLIDRLTLEETRDERFPHFGELWPAGIALARWVWRRDECRGREVLDLGCGVGLPGIAAAMRGARVVFADIFEEALALARANAEGAGLTGHEFVTLDWRDLRFARRFDAILASDLFYEARHHAPLLDFFERGLRPGGFVAAADPGRPSADPFFEAADLRFGSDRSDLTVELAGRFHSVRIVRLTRRAAPR